jgi:hypothetical protein
VFCCGGHNSVATAGGRRSSKAGSDDGKLRWSGQNPLLLRPPSAQCTTRPSGRPRGAKAPSCSNNHGIPFKASFSSGLPA